MASSNTNRHWPSMFKSKPCNSLHHHHHHHHHHQWTKHDNINSSLISPSSCHRTTYSSGVEEERSAEPKPRWNPKPEQIRILEAIFNSGMVNPPRDEIRKIRAQLQEYGQVGDANVFYWFQNRKSRSKHKLRHLHNSSNAHQTQNANSSSPKEITTPPKTKALVSNIVFSDVSSDIIAPISSTPPPPPPPQPFFYIPVQHNGGASGGVASNAVPVPITQGFCFSELSSVVQPEGTRDHHHHHHHQQINVGYCTNLLLDEIMPSHSKNDQDKAMQMQQHPRATHTTVISPAISATVTVPSSISQIQGTEEGTMKSIVFINDVAFEVGVGPLNVREAFGDDAVLIHVSGQPVLVDEWGFTLQPLQHCASYYLI